MSDIRLSVHKGSGQWSKKINGVVYYFGRIASDPQGVAARKQYYTRIEGILAGLDNLRVPSSKQEWTVGKLVAAFLVDRRTKSLAGELSVRTYGDYISELQKFADAVGVNGKVTALAPIHFSAYLDHLHKRGLGRHARKRVIAYIRAALNFGFKNGYYPSPNFGTAFTRPDASTAAIKRDRVKAGKAEYSDRIITGDEVNKLIKLATPLHRGLILMAVNTGLGVADIARLRWRHVSMETGELNMARGKTGVDRKGYLWKRTRKALAKVSGLAHNRAAIEREGDDALIFITRKGHPMYREVEKKDDAGRVKRVQVHNAISGTFGKLVDRAELKGLTFYRLRHTFKTLGKRARDPDALNLMMGHKDGSIGGIYDHEEIDPARIRRVAMAVKRALWPKPKNQAATSQEKPKMRMAG
jgi:integrase